MTIAPVGAVIPAAAPFTLPSLPSSPGQLSLLVAVGAVALALAVLAFLYRLRRSRARLRVEIQNTGNAVSHYELSAQSPEPKLRFEFGHDGHRLPLRTHLENVPGQGAGAEGAAPLSWAQTPALRPGASMALDLTALPAGGLRGGQHSFTLYSRALEAPGTTLSAEQGTVKVRGGGRAGRVLPSLAILLAGALIIVALWTQGDLSALFR